MNKTGINYLDYTWNPTTGCTFGCPECWAREVAQKRLSRVYNRRVTHMIQAGLWDEVERLGAIADAYASFTPTLHPERLDQPARRKKPSIVGPCYMGDLFDPAISDDARMEVHASMLAGNHHTYILLTKQPERMADYYELQGPDCEGELIPNIYLGFSARNQAEFDAGWPHMAKLAAAGWKVWVSLEPIQGPISLDDDKQGYYCPQCHDYDIYEFAYQDDMSSMKCAHCSFIGDPGEDFPHGSIFSTVILGAQSGRNAVPLDPAWVRSVEYQCRLAGVPFMFKQDNSTGKVVSLPELDGVQHTATAWSLS